MEAVVLFDYEAQESDELSLKKGELITKIQKREGGWWEGTLNDGKRGLFPDNFVKVISGNSCEDSTSQLQGRQFRVKYNYIPVNVDELELNVGDVVELISEVEEGWWEGKLRNKLGVFPSNFVIEITEPEVAREDKNQIMISCDNGTNADINIMEMEGPKTPTSVPTTPSDAPVLPPKPKTVKEMCITLFPYDAKHDDELTLKENDMISLLSTELPDKGWWKGQLNGKIGVFPDNFVKLIPLGEDVCKPKRPSVTKTTTNKTRDNINKQTTNSNVAALRKSLEIPVKLRGVEDNSNAKKPLISKKPGLLHPGYSEVTKTSFSSISQMEKPSLSPERSFNTSANSLSSETSSMSKSFESDGKPWTETSVDYRKNRPSSASMGDKMSTELQSSFVAKEMDGVDGSSGSKVYRINNLEDRIPDTSIDMKESASEKESDLNAIERSELLSHPTASRAKAPKRRPPSGINFKEEDIVPTTNNKYNSKVTVNGTSDSKTTAASWLKELKLSQVKKNSSQVNVRSGFTSTGSNVTFRFQRPVSMFSSETEAHSLSFQTKSLPPSTENVVATSGVVTSVTVPPVLSPEKVVTVNVSDWNSVLDKVNTLEIRLEKQNEFFTKTIEQLKTKLADEVALRIEMKSEMDKLLDLVTQV